MRWLVSVLVVLSIVMVVLPAAAQIAARPSFVEDEIAGVRIGHDTPAQVIKRYGPGNVPPGGDERLCYWLDTERAGLEFRFTQYDNVVAYVYLTMVPSEVPTGCRLRAIRPVQPVKTGKGIGIGDSLETVVRLYGQSTEQMTFAASDPANKFFDLLVSYEGQHERQPGVRRWYWVALSFKDGKVVGVAILESEESLRNMRGR